MRIFIPISTVHPHLVMSRYLYDSDFLDNYTGRSWIDWSSPKTKVGEKDIRSYSIEVPYEMYEIIRKSIRSHVNSVINAHNAIARWTPHLTDKYHGPNAQRSITNAQKVIDDYKDFKLVDRAAQKAFWKRVNEEIVVREYHFDINNLSITVEKTIG